MSSRAAPKCNVGLVAAEDSERIREQAAATAIGLYSNFSFGAVLGDHGFVV